MHSKEEQIHPVFYSTVDKIPFTHCLVCERNLLQEPDVPYMIEKNIRRYEHLGTEQPVFEFAICQPCQMEMSEALSTESRERMQTYFQENMNTSQLIRLQYEDATIEERLACCLLSGEPIAEQSEYSIYALCRGDIMEVSIFPFALSGKVLDEMASLLSAKSLGEMDDFMGNYFSGPPELREILKTRPTLFV